MFLRAYTTKWLPNCPGMTGKYEMVKNKTSIKATFQGVQSYTADVMVELKETQKFRFTEVIVSLKTKISKRTYSGILKRIDIEDKE